MLMEVGRGRGGRLRYSMDRPPPHQKIDPEERLTAISIERSNTILPRILKHRNDISTLIKSCLLSSYT